MRKNKQTARGNDGEKTDARGFPDPGGIIKQYRERLTYTDAATGKRKHWTQADLAQRLGVSEVTVRLMETRNIGLDSIERRRVLADLLKIPPALLGLIALSDLPATGEQARAESIAPLLKAAAVSPASIQLYQHLFHAYNELHVASTAHPFIADIERWMQRIQRDIPGARKPQQQELCRVLWGFHALSAKIYSDNLADWIRAFEHLNQAFDLASFLQDADLQATTLYRSGQVRFEQGAFALARVDLDGAMIYAKRAGPTVKGAVYAETGLAYALTASDLAAKTQVQRFFDHAEQLASTASQDSSYIKYGMGKYLEQRVDALITMGRASKALELLADADEVIDPTQTRRLAYITILHAEASIKLRRPEYDTAVTLLTEALEASTRINSLYNINYIKRLFALLEKSGYDSSPRAADLRLALREWNGSH